jgi:8-oxo-dGTP pyrophosphatase MutT (NUDIX family)
MDATVIQFAQKAFIERSGQLLLVRKSAADPERPNLWEVPGGRMEFGEELDAHLRREVREEVGIEIEPQAPFAMWQWTMRGRGPLDGKSVQVVAVARRCTPVTADVTDGNRVEDDFLAEAEWVPIDEILSRSLIPSLIPAMEHYVRHADAG